MPKATFDNLDPEKRDRFLHVAFQEFCQHDYRQASISHIVKTLGIAKGSVYQYFENKADLYLYLYQVATTKKGEFVQARPMAAGEDFFDWIESLWVEGLRFDAEHPMYTGFLWNVMNERDEIARGLMEQNRAQSAAFFGPLFRQYQAAGQLRADVDVDFMVHFFTQNAQSLATYMMQRDAATIWERVREGKPFMSNHPEEIMYYVKQLSRLLRSGMMKE